MRFRFVLPYGDARAAAEVAQLAEQAGWDGFFVWEPVWGFDAWVQLTAAAMRTERIRLMMVAAVGVGREALETFAAADPALQAGLLRYEVRP